MRLSWAVVGFLAVKITGLAVNAATFPTLRPAPATRAVGPRVSILVPARNEARRLPRTLPALLAQPADEILLLDDCSEDATAEIAESLVGDDSRVKVLTGRPLPDGWTGKNWACHQLAEAATGDLLVFCDADVRLAPGALDAVIAESRRQAADVFSVFPRQETATTGERTLIPLIDDVLLAFLPFRLLSLPIPAAATANGQLLAFRRGVYNALGGHSGVRQAIVEDVRLALHTRRMGHRLGLALGGDLVSARMYEGYRAAVRGFGKSLLAAHGGSRTLLGMSAAWHLLAYTAPWLKAGSGRTWRLAALLGLVERVLVNAKTGRGAWWEAALVPVTPLAAIPVYVEAARRTTTWKGRSYP